MTAQHLRTAAAKLREEGGNRNRALAFWFEHLVVRMDDPTRAGGPPAEQDELHALAVADAVLADQDVAV